jgi:hypothetical protein
MAVRLADFGIPLDAEALAAWQEVGRDASLYERLFCHPCRWNALIRRVYPERLPPAGFGSPGGRA